jgi:hypothetical protein
VEAKRLHAKNVLPKKMDLDDNSFFGLAILKNK